MNTNSLNKNNNQDFDKIKNIKNDIDKFLLYISEISAKLKEYYSELVKNNKSNIFLFGIDSLFFQNKLIDYEFKNYNELLDMITNKMYCEYFKLYKLMLKYVDEHFNDPKTLNNLKVRDSFPIYKDLEIYKKYDFQIINDIHQEIHVIFGIMHNFLVEKKQKLISHQDKNNLGLNIDNFVNTFNFEIVNFEQQINLFSNYLDFFHKLHFKHLSRFLTKIEVFYLQINNDINININNVDNENIKNEIMNENIEKNLKSPLRKSLSIKNIDFDNMSLSDQSSNNDEQKIKLNTLQHVFPSNIINNNEENNINVENKIDDDIISESDNDTEMSVIDKEDKLEGLTGKHRKNVKKRLRRKSKIIEP